VRFQADVSSLDTDNWRDNNALRQRNAGGELRTLFDQGFLALRLGAESQKIRFPGLRTIEEFKTNPRATSTPKDHAQREDYLLSLAGAWRTSSLEFEAELAHREGRVEAAFLDYISGLYDNYSVRDRRTLSFTPRLRSNWSAGGIHHETVVGLDAEAWYFTNRSSSSEVMSELNSSGIVKQQSRGVYLQHQTALRDETILTIGFRRQRVADDIRDQKQEEPSYSPHGVHWITASTFGLRKPIGAGVDAYARAGRSFRLATVDEITSFYVDSTARLLLPQTSTDREIGLQWRKVGAALRLSVFRNDLNNEIHFYKPAGDFGRNVNLPPTQRTGLELEGTFQPMPQLDLSAGITRLEARFRGGEVDGEFYDEEFKKESRPVAVSGREVPLVPRLSFKLAAVWRPLEGTRLSLSARHTGHQRYDNDQKNQFETMPSYTLVDVKASQRMGQWLAALKVGNLLDRRYFDYGILGGSPVSPSVYPQSGRTVMFSLERGF
jgi:iron complex outermembrane receptor protein